MKPQTPRPVSRKRTISGSASLRVLGYLRVSTTEQATNGAGLDAQRAAIAAEAERRGWSVQWVEDRGYSAKDLRRPGIREALRRSEERRVGKECRSRGSPDH